MKIYRFEWYEEDDYGPMMGMYVILQAENEEEAWKAVRSYIKDMYNSTIEEWQEQYEKFELTDITHYPVIISGSLGL